jgi:DNA-binding NarL/FixJ family response regulator
MWNANSGRVDVLVLIAAPLLQAGVRATLGGVAHFNVLPDPQAAREGCAQVVVTDSASGIDGSLLEQSPCQPHAKVLAICPHAREHSIEMALRSGVHGFIRASCSAQELVGAIQTLALGALYVCPDVAQRMAATFSRDPLTLREGEVLRLLARGQCNKTIARQLGIAVGTVKTHVKGIMAKLDATSRTEAASIAAEKGIVDVPEFRARRAAWSPAGLAGSRERAAGLSEFALA